MRIFFMIIGGLSLVLGLIGVVVPLLPTTPFLLLAGACFAKSSKKVASWLKSSSLYQFYVGDYLETRTIPRSKKKRIILQVVILMGLSIVFCPVKWVKIGLAILTMCMGLYIWFVVPETASKGRKEKER